MHGFTEDKENNEFASVSSSSTNSDDADAPNFEKDHDKWKNQSTVAWNLRSIAVF